MRLLLPYFIILIVIFQFILRKNSKKDEQRTQEFWKRESESNAVRKKDISNLDYIHIPESLLSITSEIPEVSNAIAKFSSFKDMTMLNLTGLSNTDLKLQYGPANLDALSSYDENCTRMLRSIISAAEALKSNNIDKEAIAFLEFGIQCRTDITSNYTMLAEYYAANNNKEGIDHLIQTANSINSMTRDSIIKKLATYHIEK